VIVLLTLLGGGVAYYLSAKQEKKYDATASISFEEETQSLSSIGDSADPSASPGQTPQARAQTIKDAATVKAVQDRLGKRIPAANLQSAITTSLDDATFLVDVTATWSDGNFAARLANLFARTAAAEINREAREGFEASLKDVRSRLEGLNPEDLADQVEFSALTNQRTRLQFLSDNAKPATISQVAVTPGAPTSPTPFRNTIIGLLLGLVIGILVAFLRDSLDQRLHGPGEVRALLPYPIVGHLANDAMGKVLHGEGGSAGERDGIEQIQILRQNLYFLDVDNPPKVILVTSALPEEGKSTVAASLAHAAAAFGAQTLLLECDLRRPALAERFGIERVPGLTDHVAGRAALDSIFRLIDLDAPAGENGAGPSRLAGGSLAMIPAGAMSPQPAEILESGRFEHFLDAVKQVYDIVIVDSAPLLPVADTLELLPGADCVVLCVRSGQTTQDQARAVHGVLEHYPSKPTGLAITGLKRRDASDYGYYGYEAFGGGREIEVPNGPFRSNGSVKPPTASTAPTPKAHEPAAESAAAPRPD
jgi:capsular exopolysaccharide synthesis family protein